jgi:dienelactone hydrolase
MPKELQIDDNAPWKQRLRAPVIVWTQLARSQPSRGLAVSNKSGKYQLYAWDVPTGNLRQLTDRSAGVLLGAIASDGRHVYYLHDQQGSEIGHYVRIPFAGGEPEDISPDLPPYSILSFGMSRAANRLGFTAATAEGFCIYTQRIGPSGELGTPHQLYHHQRLAFGPWFSPEGEIAVLATTEQTITQHYNLVAFDTSSGERLGELWDGPEASLEAVGFSPVPGDFRLLATTNCTGVKRPLIWRPRTGERVDLALTELQGEVVPLDWAPDSKRILLCQFNQAVQQLYTYDLATSTLTRLYHPGGTFGFFAALGTYFASEDEIFAQWQDSTHPSQLITLDSRTGGKLRTALSEGEVPPSHPWKSITFLSSEGQMIQGWLGLPNGEGPFPTILHTHWGPEAVTTEVFDPISQSWMDHGFAFLTINYRGSTTFGREFQEMIWGNPGHWEVADMAAARDWLVKEGIGHPDQTLLTGWSYGGYLTLLGLGKRPDLWAGGMAGTAIADWRVMYEDSADTLKGYLVALFGGTPQEKPEQYATSSPITYVENVRAAVLIIQGRNDTRTPARPVEMYEQKLKALGKSVEVHWFDAGHLGAGVEQDIKHQFLMLRFAYRVLG